jgi:hypothetical protein
MDFHNAGALGAMVVADQQRLVEPFAGAQGGVAGRDVAVGIAVIAHGQARAIDHCGPIR